MYLVFSPYNCTLLLLMPSIVRDQGVVRVFSSYNAHIMQYYTMLHNPIHTHLSLYISRQGAAVFFGRTVLWDLFGLQLVN